MKKRIVMVNPRPGGRPERPVIEDDARKHMGLARLKLIGPYEINGKPYLASAVMSMRFVEAPGLGTLGVDSSWRLYYDPDEIIYWPLDALAAVIEHEVWHLLRRHSYRAQNLGINQFSGDTWNIAADIEIHSNEQLLKEVSKVPDFTPYHPGTFGLTEKKTVEYYYDKIKDSEEYEDKGRDKGRPDEDEGRPGEDEGRPGYGEPGAVTGISSSADGIPRPHELPPTDEVVNRAEEENIRRTVAEAIRAAKSRGEKGIGDHVSEWAGMVLEPPKVDWRDLLRNAIETAVQFQQGNLQYTWGRLSRRQVASPDFMLPGMHSPIPEIAVVLDSSGSMYTAATAPESSEEAEEGEDFKTLLNAALHEIGGILEEHGASIGVNILVTDTVVQFAQRVFSLEDIQLIGGGGTDMSVGLEAAALIEPPPNVIVCLTDGYTPWPEHRPEVEATYIVGIVGSTEQELAERWPPPQWADEIIYIDEL